MDTLWCYLPSSNVANPGNLGQAVLGYLKADAGGSWSLMFLH